MLLLSRREKPVIVYSDNGILYSNEVLQTWYETRLINLKNTVLSERSQIQRKHILHKAIT